jgi:hypothetical protein
MNNILSLKTAGYGALMYAAGAVLVFFHCSLLPFSGGGTEGGNVSGLFVNGDGTSSAMVRVLLVPADYNAGAVNQNKPIHSAFTATDGSYSFGPVSKGSYSVEAFNTASGKRSLITGITVSDKDVRVPIDTMRNPGTIKIFLQGTANTATGYFFVPGTTIYSAIDGTNGFITITSVPAATLPPLSYSEHGLSSFDVIRYGVEVLSGDTTVVYNPLWKYAQRLFLNTTAGGADVSGDVHNFPVLVRLTAGNFAFAQAQADGADIRFTKSDSTFLSYDIERWNVANGTAEIWVKIDTIFGNDSTQFITMYWGNTDAADSSKPAAVFDTAAGFAGVWHLGQPAGAIVPDATANGINGTATATATVSGAIGTAQSFNGTSSLIQTSATASNKVNFSDSGTYSISAWIKTSVLDSFCQAIVFKSNSQYGMQIIPEHDWEFATYIDKTRWESSRSPASAGSWHALTGVRNGTRQYLYVDGVCVDSSITNTIALPPENIARVYDMPLEIGHCPDGGRNPDRYFKGTIDEVRISRTALNSDWMKLSYMNQKEQDALVKW